MVSLDALASVLELPRARRGFVQHGVLTDSAIAKEMFQSIHLPHEAPPIARARSRDPIDDLPTDDWE